MIYGYITLKID